ncbi:hypothetical protein P691DRAFT_689288, partial [Macrolepiota fuliginosa MF-IS2]
LKDMQLWIIGVKNLVVEVDAKYIKGMINNPDIQPSVAVNWWISAILLFDFCLRHVPGCKHGLDGLLQCPQAPEDLQEDNDYEQWINTTNSFALLHPSLVNNLSSGKRGVINNLEWVYGVNTFTMELINKTPTAQQQMHLLCHLAPPHHGTHPHTTEVFTSMQDSPTKNTQATILRSDKAKTHNSKLPHIQAFLENLK